MLCKLLNSIQFLFLLQPTLVMFVSPLAVLKEPRPNDWQSYSQTSPIPPHSLIYYQGLVLIYGRPSANTTNEDLLMLAIHASTVFTSDVTGTEKREGRRETLLFRRMLFVLTHARYEIEVYLVKVS